MKLKGSSLSRVICLVTWCDMMRQCATECPECTPGDCRVLSEGEKVRLRALTLFIIRSIAERHGGSIKIDLATDSIYIEVPDEESSACAQEIEAQMGAMCH
ncbi:MAG: hypothetical protein HWN69_03245 [Desulfobacterales bacterium]|nr:hypothetical protein [Desulfobacterales bacterium]